MQNNREFSRMHWGQWGMAPELNEAESFDSITNQTLLPTRLEMLREALYKLNSSREIEYC